ncbi:MAG TPA: hypothetical protein VMF69_14130, partial [Gemmataceae bacterium]|nr:hypothetical protein [Gemmataceae bacterium]
ELYLQALTIRQQVVEHHPHITRYKDELVLNHESLTAFYSSINRPSSAEEHLREAVKLRLQLGGAVSAVPQPRIALARVYSVLAETCARAGRYAEAEAECRKGSELIEPLARDRPNDRSAALVLAENLGVLGHLQIQNHKPQEGIATMTRAITLFEELLRKAPDDNSVRMLLREAYGIRASALKSRGELLKTVGDLLRIKSLEQPPRPSSGK